MEKSKALKVKDILKQVPRPQLLGSFVVAFILCAITVNTKFYRVDAYFYDLHMRLTGTERVHPDLLLLQIEDKDETAQSLEAQLRALEKLVAQRPRAILYLNRFDSAEVEMNPSLAERFVAIARQAASAGTQVYLGTDVDLSGEILPPYPLSLLPHYPSILHKDGTMFAEDKVTRRALLTATGEPTLHMRAAYPGLTDEQLRAQAQRVRGSYYYSTGDAWHVLIRFPGNTASGSHPFPALNFSQALSGEGLEKAAGKIVLIDNVRRNYINDFAFTPYSRTVYTNPRLVVHAAIIDSLLKEGGIVMFTKRVDRGLTFLCALLLAFVAITMQPSRGVLALFGLSAALFLVSVVLFRMGYSLLIAHPLLAMFFTYYLIVPYRAILEYKKRWEVQEKHDLLIQVEEMKGNFLSLMSHDLKTPVARIQGLAELVIRQGGLLPQQREELQQIIASTENLDKFISKILNLTKVESNEIKLNKRSKDVNKILEQCANNLAFQAQAKGVQLDLSLEPLFPIQADPALLIQVFTNIIDNAIKYSPPGSRVRVLSREVGDTVEITVEDSGAGLDEEERRQLFTKFFRGKSHPGDQTKGSGLGLYLSKYFIELHAGGIEAQSRKGEGSKFTVRLPIEGGTA